MVREGESRRNFDENSGWGQKKNPDGDKGEENRSKHVTENSGRQQEGEGSLSERSQKFRVATRVHGRSFRSWVTHRVWVHVEYWPSPTKAVRMVTFRT